MRTLALALALAGCTTHIVDVVDAVPFDPPQMYREWYNRAAQCVGTTGDFDRVRWFVVPGDTWFDDWVGREIAGRWVPPHNIYIADGERDWEWIVRHESIHDQLQDGAHPTPPFGLCDNPEEG